MQYRCEDLDAEQLARILGAAADPMGPTVLVAGRPQTRNAVEARGHRLIARADDPTITNEQWLRQWRRLNDAWFKLPAR